MVNLYLMGARVTYRSLRALNRMPIWVRIYPPGGEVIDPSDEI